MTPASKAAPSGSATGRETGARKSPRSTRPVPGGVSHQGRQDDRADPLGHRAPEGEIQQRHEQEQHQELPQLHADVEGHEGRQQVGSRELQRLPEGEREAEPVDEAEDEGDPSSGGAAAGETMFSSAM